MASMIMNSQGNADSFVEFKTLLGDRSVTEVVKTVSNRTERFVTFEGVDPGGVVIYIDFTEEEYEESMDGEITGLGVALLDSGDGWRVVTDAGP